MKSSARKGVRKLLLVDDEPDITASLKVGLEAHGLQVDGFNDSLHALASFSPKKYDLAILDIRMPRMNGFELFSEIRKLEPELPIWFMTAFDEYPKEFERLFPETKAQAFLHKPISIATLLLLLQTDESIKSLEPA